MRGLSLHSFWRDGSVAEISSLLNCRTGQTVPGVRIPLSPPVGKISVLSVRRLSPEAFRRHQKAGIRSSFFNEQWLRVFYTKRYYTKRYKMKMRCFSSAGRRVCRLFLNLADG